MRKMVGIKLKLIISWMKSCLQDLFRFLGQQTFHYLQRITEIGILNLDILMDIFLQRFLLVCSR